MATIMAAKISQKIGGVFSAFLNTPILIQRSSSYLKLRCHSSFHFPFHRFLYSSHGLVNTCCFHQPLTGSAFHKPSLFAPVCLRRWNLHSNTSKQLTTDAETQVIEEEPDDRLYKWIELKVKGHDDAVLESYARYISMAASELNVNIESIEKPFRHIRKLTLLKSRHVYKKHRVQYEMRTYYRVIKLKHLTGSTASVFLEYIERNLPEGLAMQVKKCSIRPLPDHLQTPPEQLEEEGELISSSSDSSWDSSNDEKTSPV